MNSLSWNLSDGRLLTANNNKTQASLFGMNLSGPNLVQQISLGMEYNKFFISLFK